jgi:hypothetical protein
MTPGFTVGLAIAACAGLVAPRFGFGMLLFVVIADMVAAWRFGS